VDEKKILKLIALLTVEEIGYLRRLRVGGPRDTGDFSGDVTALKSLEVRDLVFRRGTTLNLTHRGKLIARHL